MLPSRSQQERTEPGFGGFIADLVADPDWFCWLAVPVVSAGLQPLAGCGRVGLMKPQLAAGGREALVLLSLW